MAKKVVATLRDKSKGVGMIKVIRSIKNADTGSYSFKQDMVAAESLQQYMKDNNLK